VATHFGGASAPSAYLAYATVVVIVGNPSQSYGASPAVWDHTVLPDTGERAPPWPQPHRPVLDLHTQEEWKAELVGYIPRCFTGLQTVTNPSSNHLIVTRPGVELMTSRL